MASFDAVNYAIRPNKAIERKIVFAGLSQLTRILDWSTYRYVGLGSVWFVDFLIAHKSLSIQSMVSIEADLTGYERALFNCPFSCIDVIRGDTSLIIPTLDLGSRPSIVWFDYDTSIDGPVLPDISMLMSQCAPNSVLIVTINAKKNALPKNDPNGVLLNEETSLRRIAGDLVPTPLPSRRLQQKHYPGLLREIVSNQFRNCAANSARSEIFVELFDLEYADGTPMITVGGILAAPETAERVRTLVSSPAWQGFVSAAIKVPPLTLKEKLTLDQMMPCSAPPIRAELEAVGLWLTPEQIAAYHQHYKHYPIFGELFS